jgi:small-conductance mechanosensitive channel
MAASFESFVGGDLGSWAIRGARILIILIVAFVVARLVRRLVKKLAARLAERQEKRRSEQEADTGDRFGVLREHLVDALPTAERRERAAQRARTLGSTAASVCGIVVWVLALMLCLSELRINLGPILAGAGIAGLALGFGAQNVVRDFLSGAFIIAEDQYGVGDVVDVGEATGVVEDVSFRSTKVRGLDGTLWHVPNGEIKRSGNKSQYWARVILDVPVAYGADLTAASMLIKRVADEVWHEHESADILEEPEILGVQDLGADSVVVRLVVKTMPGSQWAVARELRGKLKDAYDGAGLEIPFPQRTVWLRTSE